MSDHQMSIRRQRARKGYVCDECLTAIRQGQQYDRASVIRDGKWLTYFAHAECSDWRSELERRNEIDEEVGLFLDPAHFADGAPDVVRQRLLDPRSIGGRQA